MFKSSTTSDLTYFSSREQAIETSIEAPTVTLAHGPCLQWLDIALQKNDDFLNS